MSLKSALKADNTTIMGRTQGVKNGKISQYLQRATKVPLRGMGPVCSFLWWTQACPSGHGPPLSPATRPPCPLLPSPIHLQLRRCLLVLSTAQDMSSWGCFRNCCVSLCRRGCIRSIHQVKQGGGYINVSLQALTLLPCCWLNHCTQYNVTLCATKTFGPSMN